MFRGRFRCVSRDTDSMLQCNGAPRPSPESLRLVFRPTVRGAHDSCILSFFSVKGEVARKAGTCLWWERSVSPTRSIGEFGGQSSLVIRLREDRRRSREWKSDEVGLEGEVVPVPGPPPVSRVQGTDTDSGSKTERGRKVDTRSLFLHVIRVLFVIVSGGLTLPVTPFFTLRGRRVCSRGSASPRLPQHPGETQVVSS